MQSKIAVVTGGSRGIGGAIALALAREGYDIAFSYVQNEVAAESLRATIIAMGRDCLIGRCDISDEQSIESFFTQIEQRYEYLDVLVNNAGITRDGLLATLSFKDITSVIQTNLIGTMLCCQRVLPSMMRKRSGCIINISSVAAQKPNKGQSNYAAAKGGIEALTRALAVELAPRNIRVNCVAPGVINTDMSRELLATQADAIQSRLLIKRYAEADEIAQVVIYLIEQGHYMTGEVLSINGGLKML